MIEFSILVACRIVSRSSAVMTPGGFLIAKIFLAGYLEATRSCLNDRLSTIRRSALTPAFKVSRESTSPTAMTLGGLVSRIMRASWGIVSSAGPGTSFPNGVLSLARSSGLGLRVILSPQWQRAARYLNQPNAVQDDLLSPQHCSAGQ